MPARIRFDGRLLVSDSPDVTAADSVARQLLLDLMVWDKRVTVEPEPDTPMVKGYPKFLVMSGIERYDLLNVNRLVDLYSVDNDLRWKIHVFNYPGYLRVNNPTSLVPVGIPNSTKRDQSAPDPETAPRIQRQWDEMHHMSLRDTGKLFVACSGANSEEFWRGDHQVILNNTLGLKLFSINELPDADQPPA